MSNLVQYGSYTLDAVERELKQMKGGDTWLKLEVGKNLLRFLPPAVGVPSPFVIASMHFVSTPGETQTFSFPCPKRTKKQRCPLCEKADSYHHSGNPQDQELAKDLWPRKRIFAYVINRLDEEAGPILFGFGVQIHEQLTDLRKNKEIGDMDFCDPINGYDIVIERVGTKRTDTEYKVRPRMEKGAVKFSKLHDDPEVMNTWITGQPNIALLDHMIVPTYDDIVAKLSGGAAPKAPRQPSAATGAAAAPKGRTIVDAETGKVVTDDLPY
jgi:hypothetical protein